MPGPDPRVRDAVAALLRSQDHAALRTCLVSNPDELLSEQADALLAEVTDSTRSAHDTLKPSDMRAMLAEARAHGLLALLARLAPVSQETVDHVQRFGNAGNWHYVFRELERNTEAITSGAAAAWMENLSVANRRDHAAASRLNPLRSLAEVAGRARHRGLESALSGVDVGHRDRAARRQIAGTVDADILSDRRVVRIADHRRVVRAHDRHGDACGGRYLAPGQ